MLSQPFQRTRADQPQQDQQTGQNYRSGDLFLYAFAALIAFVAVLYQLGDKFVLLGVRFWINPERVAAFFHFFDDGLG